MGGDAVSIGGMTDRGARPNMSRASTREEKVVTQDGQAQAEIERRLCETTLLYQVSSLIASAEDVSAALHGMCALLAQFLEVPQAGFAILNAERSQAKVIADYHPPKSPSALGTVIPVADNPSMTFVLSHKAPLVVDQAQHDPLLAPVHALMQQRHVCSILLVPILADAEVIGTLGFDAFEDRSFSATDVDLIQYVANQAGQLLKRKWIEGELQGRARQLAALYETSLEINSQPDLPTLLQALVHRAAELVGVSMGLLYLVQPSEERLEAVVTYNLPSSFPATPLSVGEGLAGRVAQSGRPMMVANYRDWEGRASSFDVLGLRRLLAVPLRLGDRVIGVLDLTDYETGLFDEEQVRLATLFADQAAIAVENARHVTETEHLKAFNESIVQGVVDGILMEDCNGRITFVNPAMEAMLGYSRQELLDRHWTEIVAPDQIEKVRQELALRTANVSDRYETVLVGKAGQRIPVVVSARPIFEEGQYAGALTTFTDITERVRNEHELVERRTYLEAVLASAPDAIVTLDSRQQVVEWNPGAERLFGFSHEEAIGKSIYDLILTRDTIDEAVELMLCVSGGRSVLPTETIRYRKDGTQVDVSLTGAPIVVDGQVSGAVVSYTDVSERKRAERALRKANRGLHMLSQSNKALSRAKDEPSLLREICQIATEIGGYCLAWVGYPEQDEAKTIRPIAQAGFGDGDQEALKAAWADPHRGSSPIDTAIRLGKPRVVRSVPHGQSAPWQEDESHLTYASLIALPLLADGQCIGALTIYAEETNAFDREEVGLLTELADNLAYGIASLRARGERTWLEERVECYTDRLATLRAIDRAILEAQSATDIASATLARLAQLIPYRSARIATFEAQLDRPTVLAASTNGEFTQLDAVSTPVKSADSEVTVPLMAQGELIGTLHLQSNPGDGFSREHLEVAYDLASPLAVAIHHASIHDQLRQRAGSLEEILAQYTSDLQLERDRTRAILESLGEAVVVTDVDGTVLYTNPATEVLTGYENNEVLGQSCRQLLGNAHLSEILMQAQGLMHAGQTWRGEAINFRKDSSHYDAAITATPLFAPEDPGQLIGSVWVQRDITPLKEAGRFKDRFVSDVSHELRTPLSAIALVAGNLENLYDRVDDSKRRQMIRSIREQVGLLNDLIGGVLEISRIDSGRVSMDRETVDLVELMLEEVDKQGLLARRKSLLLSTTGVESLSVMGNEGQLRQIIRNLVNNAIKYTPDRGRITCECFVHEGRGEPGMEWAGSTRPPDGRWAVLGVTDTGIGIRPDDIPHLFERFYRVKTQSNVPGTGLGLAIALQLTELHGGYIGVSSIEAQGSIFALYLPLRAEGS